MTGITRTPSSIMRTIAALISAVTHGPVPVSLEKKIVTAWQRPRPSLIRATKSSPGEISQVSSQASIPRSRRRRAKSSTAGLSIDRWLGKT